MAMSFTYDDGYDYQPRQNGLRRIIASWTSSGAGAASGTTSKIVGTLVKAVTVPTDGPTDNYDIAITDEQSVDVLAACKTSLANRDTTTTEETYFFLLNADTSPLSMRQGPSVCGQLSIAITNAGATKSGVLHLYYRG